MNVVLLPALIIAVNAAVWLFVYFRFRTKCSPEAVLYGIRDEVASFLRDIRGEVEQDITLIDDRIQSLRDLIKESDGRIVLLDTELKKREIEKLVLDRIQNKPPVAEPAVTAGAGTGEPPVKIPDAVKTDEPAVPKKSVREQVIEFASSGLAPEFIAQKLSISITEVQLFIELGGL
jgi:hypothetical protein